MKRLAAAVLLAVVLTPSGAVAAPVCVVDCSPPPVCPPPADHPRPISCGPR